MHTDTAHGLRSVGFQHREVRTDMNARIADLELARRTLKLEGEAISALAEQIDETFAGAAREVFQCGGKVVLTGIGKAGIIAQKISATLASTFPTADRPTNSSACWTTSRPAGRS